MYAAEALPYTTPSSSDSSPHERPKRATSGTPLCLYTDSANSMILSLVASGNPYRARG
jgi:hypothetical protein